MEKSSLTNKKKIQQNEIKFIDEQKKYNKMR